MTRVTRSTNVRAIGDGHVADAGGGDTTGATTKQVVLDCDSNMTLSQLRIACNALIASFSSALKP
jgi:hypothetical protein